MKRIKPLPKSLVVWYEEWNHQKYLTFSAAAPATTAAAAATTAAAEPLKYPDTLRKMVRKVYFGVQAALVLETSKC